MEFNRRYKLCVEVVGYVFILIHAMLMESLNICVSPIAPPCLLCHKNVKYFKFVFFI